MHTATPLRRSLAPLGLGLLVALGLALLLAIGWLGVRGQDMADLTLYLLMSGALSLGVGALGDGDLNSRVDEAGGDELAALAAEFNRMAAQLAAAAAERGRLETERRE